MGAALSSRLTRELRRTRRELGLLDGLGTWPPPPSIGGVFTEFEKARAKLQTPADFKRAYIEKSLPGNLQNSSKEQR